jgi:hypothetical protein
MAKGKVKVWCQCESPRPLLDGNGKPYSAEPICRKPDGCGYAIKLVPPGLRTPPEPRIQDPSPGPSWTGPGQCPPPPETQTEAYRRGHRLAVDPSSAPVYVTPAPTPISAPPRTSADRQAALARLKRLRSSSSN